MNDVVARWNQTEVIDESRFEIENLVDAPESRPQNISDRKPEIIYIPEINETKKIENQVNKEDVKPESE